MIHVAHIRGYVIYAAEQISQEVGSQYLICHNPLSAWIVINNSSYQIS